ncbi:MAG: HdeD family acid-resistance protein [Rhodospirillaceae bacterium]|nr:HdeD family acid-resistance protein [Rhodospirillaceae bacterium]
MTTTAPHPPLGDGLNSPRLDDAFSSQPRWALILRGVAGILFGVVAFALPGITFLMLIAMFAGYMLVDGVFAIVSGLKAGREGRRWWPFVLEGVANLAVGAIALVWPGATALALVFLVAIWSIFTGVLLMFPNPSQTTGSRILLALAGLVSILLGIAMILQPVAGSLAVVWLTGGYGIVFGGLMLAAGIRMRPASKASALS